MGEQRAADKAKDAGAKKGAGFFGIPSRRPKTASGLAKKDFASFKRVYSSRDGRMLVFEDADGHLCSVRADRLA